MNKTGIIGGVIVLIIVIAGAAYYLNTMSVPPSITTAASTSIAATTMAPTTASGSNSTTTAAAPTTASTAYTVKLENSSTYGQYLANASGYTLYTYGGDTQNTGTSACTGGCASAWPPFYTASLVLQAGLNASSFATITRSDGSKQITYKGWPLYFYSGDSQPGQVSGNGVNNFKVATK